MIRASLEGEYSRELVMGRTLGCPVCGALVHPTYWRQCPECGHVLLMECIFCHDLTPTTATDGCSVCTTINKRDPTQGFIRDMKAFGRGLARWIGW